MLLFMSHDKSRVLDLLCLTCKSNGWPRRGASLSKNVAVEEHNNCIPPNPQPAAPSTNSAVLPICVL
jgi:hypothetical protein